MVDELLIIHVCQACPYLRDPVLRSQALQILAMDFNLLRFEDIC